MNIGKGDEFIVQLVATELGGKKYAILLTGTFLLFAGLVPAAAIFTYDAALCCFTIGRLHQDRTIL